jgi:hypothetical protein
MQVTAALSPSSPMPTLVVADPALQGKAEVRAEEEAPTRVNGAANHQPTATAGTVPDGHADEALSMIHDRIIAALTTGNDGAGTLAPNIQRELARLLGLLPHVAARSDRLLLGSVDLALSSLLGSSPSVAFARETRLNIAQRLGIYPSLRWALTSSPIPAVRVMTGLLIVLGVAIPMLAVTVFLLRAHVADLNSPTLDLDDLILFGIFGAAGSVISIMVRIDEFNRWPPDPSILFFTGLFKPIIGFFFAIFVLLALNSGIVQISLTEERQAYFFMAIAFIAGFSERFARDIASQTESIFPGSAGQSDRSATGAVSRAPKR